MKKLHKSALIGVGALILSTVAIQASDLTRGITGNFAGMAIESQSVCGEGAVLVLLGSHSICVDIFEASAGDSCPHLIVDNQNMTQENANTPACEIVSKQNTQPWNFVSVTQAQQFCARSGKRLPNNEEWYKIVSGLSDQSSCIIKSGDSKPSKTGSTNCVTPSGVYDMVGNVWEWIDDEVNNGEYHNHTVPASGYVSAVDTDGVVLATGQVGLPEFGNDYALTGFNGVLGIIRGGFYGSGEDGGVFSQNLSVPLDFRSVGVGFRCVRDI